MHESLEDYFGQLADSEVSALRESTCEVLANGLCSTGAVLWTCGLAEQPRRSIAAAIQMSGEAARGSVLLLRENNLYAAAALVRQLVEIEYLLCLFALDQEEPLKWASMDEAAVRKEYQPARMRERCGTRFRASEYSIHCQVGGHPRVAGTYLLPQHGKPSGSNEVLNRATAWVDLGQPLVQAWRWAEEILVQYDLMSVGIAKSSLDSAKAAIATWMHDDASAPRLTEAEVAFLAQASKEPGIVH